MDALMDKPASRRRPRAGAVASAEAGAQEDLSLGLLNSLVGFHLRLAQDASFRSYSRRVGLRDLKPGRFAAMMVIYNNPGVNQTALGRAIARDKSTVTPLLQQLERQGLISRSAQAGDGRSFQLHLTAAGERTLHELLEVALEHDRKLDEIVGDRKPDFIALLKRIWREVG